MVRAATCRTRRAARAGVSQGSPRQVSRARCGGSRGSTGGALPGVAGQPSPGPRALRLQGLQRSSLVHGGSGRLVVSPRSDTAQSPRRHRFPLGAGVAARCARTLSLAASRTSPLDSAKEPDSMALMVPEISAHLRSITNVCPSLLMSLTNDSDMAPALKGWLC